MNIARGTRVELINLKNTQGYTDYSKSTSNTVGNVGNVTENDGGGHMWVEWNNGSYNSYREKKPTRVR